MSMTVLANGETLEMQFVSVHSLHVRIHFSPSVFLRDITSDTSTDMK